MTRALITLLLASWPAITPAEEAVFAKVIKETAAPTVSANVRNIGQSMHLVVVICPAASAAVGGLAVRIEASFDNSLWFPISADITAAPRLAGLTYQIEKAYGVYPYIRVRSLTTAPTILQVWYTGQLFPTVSYISQESDRFVL